MRVFFKTRAHIISFVRFVVSYACVLVCESCNTDCSGQYSRLAAYRLITISERVNARVRFNKKNTSYRGRLTTEFVNYRIRPLPNYKGINSSVAPQFGSVKFGSAEFDSFQFGSVYNLRPNNRYFVITVFVNSIRQMDLLVSLIVSFIKIYQFGNIVFIIKRFKHKAASRPSLHAHDASQSTHFEVWTPIHFQPAGSRVYDRRT